MALAPYLLKDMLLNHAKYQAIPSKKKAKF